jgi:hypothetical protein
MTKQIKKENFIKNNMYKEQIKQLYISTIDSNRKVAKQLNVENLKKIIHEFESYPEELKYSDARINYEVFKAELEIRLNEL